MRSNKIYPSITDPDFYTQINKLYSKYEIPSKKKSFQDFCYPTKYELQIPQKFLAEYLNPDTPYKGLLVYHKIGGGKTCVAISIAERFKKHSKIIVVLPASLQGNFRNELRTQCADQFYISERDRETLRKLSPSDPKYRAIIEKSDVEIDKYYSIYSYNKFVDILKTASLDLTNTLLIIDEIQNMVSEEGIYNQKLYELVTHAPPSMRLVIMTATPIFDKPIELALTMNLLLKRDSFPVGREFVNEYISITRNPNGRIDYQTKNLDKIKKLCKGFVSYYRGAPDYVFPKSEIYFVKCVMSDEQVMLYNSIIKMESKNDPNINDQMIDIFDENISNNFYIGTRMVSNFMYTYKENYDILTNKDFKQTSLKRLSMKYYKIIANIKNSKGTIFIYSNFKGRGGVRSLVRALEQNGYKNYADNGVGTNRFAVWSGDEDMSYREEIKDIFNKKDNELGENLKIIFGTSAIKEGVTLLRVQEVHILEPYWNMSRLEQVMGRAIRFCSHKDVSKVGDLVKVYIYLATHPSIKFSVDEKIMDMAINKKIINSHFEQALKESAIDCWLFRNANGLDTQCAD